MREIKGTHDVRHPVWILGFLATLALFVMACGSQAAPTPTLLPAATPTFQPGATPSAIPTEQPTEAPVPTSTSQPGATPTATATNQPTSIPNPPTPSPAPGATSTPTSTSMQLSIVAPADESVADVSPITVRGKASVGAVVSINGDVVDVDAAGDFSTQVALEEGPNVLDIIATDEDGGEATASLTIYFTP